MLTEEEKWVLEDVWLKTIKKDLEVANININLNNRFETINTLEDITRERQEWRKLTKILMQ